MSSGDQLQKRAYLRSLSTKIRKWHVRTGLSFIVEDPVIGGVEGLARSIMITVCRNRQRLLQQAWNYWTTNTGVTHDYTEDLTAILIHPLDADQMRTELEIEVIYKWMKQQSDRDYTGIAHTVMSCSSRRAIVNLLQSCRLERYAPGEPIIFQSALPRPEDGHFTVLRGSCDCVRLPPESVAFSRLQGAVKRRQWDAARDLLGHRGNESGASSTAAEAKDVKGNNHSHGSVLAHLLPPAGFGELSAMTNVARAVTVRASWNSAPEGPAPPADVMTETAVSPLNSKTVPRTLPTAGSNGFFGGTENVISIPKGHTDVLVVPKETFTACVAARRKASLRGAAPSEAIELFRQTGLAKGVQSKDLMRAANSMSKHVLQEGDVIFCRGQKADRLFLVVSGDVVLDTSALNATNTDSEGRFVPFMHSQSSDVFHVSGGTVLGDEGLTGAESVYTSTAAVASQMAVIFEAQPSGYAHYFLTQRVNGIRYSALAYKDLPRWTVPIAEAEDSNLYSHLNSLRRVIAFCRPWRGQLATKDWALTESEAQQAHFSAGGVRDVVQTRRKERIALAHTSRNSDAQLEAAAAKERQKLLQKQKQLEKQKLKPKPNQRGSGDAADELSVASGESRHHDLAHSHHQNEHNAPRIHSHGAVGILNRMQLNAARALNAQSKKFLADHYQVHARTNILQDQLLKEDRLLPHEENADAEPEHKVQSANQLQEINHFSIDMSQEDALAASIAVAGVHTHVGNNPSKTALLVNSATDTMGRTMGNDDKAAMSRKARRKYVQSVARRLKAALSLYHNRVASFVEASNDGGDDAIRVADSAALVAMFQSAAAGAMRDAVEIEDEGGMGEIALPQDESASPQDRVSEDSAGAARQVTPGLPHLSRDHPQLTVEEEAQRPGESVLQYQERLSALLRRPAISLYLAHVDYTRSMHPHAPKIEVIDHSLFLAPKEAALMSGPESGDARGNIDGRPGSPLSFYRPMPTGPAPSMVNATNWRPPSAPSSPDRGAGQPLLAQPFSKPTQRNDSAIVRTSPWKPRSPTYIRSEHQALGASPSLQSLKWDPRMGYSTIAERLAAVPSSGYGQKYIESAAQSALGMSLQEFRDESRFQRPGAPTLHRRMVSLGLSAVAGTQDGEQYPTEEVGGTWREDRGKAFQGTVGLGTATRSSGMDMSSPSPPELLNMTANMDIDSPLGFLTALERTHFQPRKAFLVRNGWQTRCFKVTDNSATPPEGASGCSRWFIDWCRKAGLSDEAQVDAAWNALQERQQRRGGKGGLTVAALAGNAPEDPTAVGEAPSTGTVSETHSLAPHNPQDVLNADLGPAKLLRVESESGSGAPSAPVSARPLRPAPIQTRSDACADPGSNGTAMPPAVAEAGAPATASSSVAPTPMAGAKVDIFSPKNRPKPGKTAMEEQYHLHRLPSVALARFAAAVVDGDEYSSRAYLEGRRRHQANSRFRLAPVAVPALCANTANATGTTASPAAIAVLLDREIVRNRHKDHALRSCLLPDQTAPNHVQAVLTGTASAKSAVGLVTKASAFSDRASGPLAADSNLKDADSGARTNVLDAMAQLHGSPAEAAITTDPDIIGWKEYSCHAALNDHLGPSKSLPVLSLAPKDPFSKPPKKSSLKFGNGSLAAVEGKIDQDINMYSSYLDVYKASYAKSAAQRNHLHNR